MENEIKPRYTKTKISIGGIIALGILYFIAPEEVKGVISFLFAFMG